MIKILLLVFLFTTFVYAKTPFTLTGIKELYPVVEISADYVPQRYVAIIKQKLIKKVQALGISTKNFSDRSIAVLISGLSIADEPVVHVKLLIGENIKREDGVETFAMTYANEDIFEIFKLDEDLNESIDNLLEQFAEQYKEDNE
ncbi:MAG: hypothetical protein PHX13_11435 [Thiovulaceae bacterium]|nr:hypothetical protein [Sulfurimonadaceae bacterium]